MLKVAETLASHGLKQLPTENEQPKTENADPITENSSNNVPQKRRGTSRKKRSKRVVETRNIRLARGIPNERAIMPSGIVFVPTASHGWMMPKSTWTIFASSLRFMNPLTELMNITSVVRPWRWFVVSVSLVLRAKTSRPCPRIWLRATEASPP
jgi:hypothetical protein